MANTVFTKDIGDLICKRLAEGESLITITKDEGMPDKATVYRWLQKEEMAEFRDQYTRARESQAEHYLDEIIEIADNSTDDVIFLTSEDGNGEGAKASIKHSAIQRARLQIDTRKWAMSKLAPKKYGEKVQHGGDAENPIAHTMNHTVTFIRPGEDTTTE